MATNRTVRVAPLMAMLTAVRSSPTSASRTRPALQDPQQAAQVIDLVLWRETRVRHAVVSSVHPSHRYTRRAEGSCSMLSGRGGCDGGHQHRARGQQGRG